MPNKFINTALKGCAYTTADYKCVRYGQNS